MTRIFNDDISANDKFVVTLELVPGRESGGRATDSIKEIANQAFNDGRISAVSITDNPGGNPALSPDVLGRDILDRGMDVIVHFTCRDANRMGLESRALQLAHMGLKNILTLTGDFAGEGFGGRGAAVFDFDSVVLTSMLKDLNRRLIRSGDEAVFITGCAVSPFKYTEAESWVQFKKLERKVEEGASFTITQLGYDVDKYEELLLFMRDKDMQIPALASLYHLGKGSARVMNAGKVPGVHVSQELLQKIAGQWDVPDVGRREAVERTARLGVVLKGIGYKGIHIGGIHGNFDAVEKILDRMEAIEHNWEEYREEFTEDRKNRFYLYRRHLDPKRKIPATKPIEINLRESCHYLFLRTAHEIFFDKKASLAPVYKKVSFSLDKAKRSWILKRFFEDPFKKIMLSCEGCGDCGIQHVGFLCPESGCPKHTRNGACGGSKDGYCEVNVDRLCVWVRAYRRMKKYGELEKLTAEFVPPRLWELKDTSSWVNFHLDRDHQKEQK